MFDFLKADDAIKESRNCSDISIWVRSVAEKLDPAIIGYSNRQIDLVLAYLLIEKSSRDENYNNILSSFTEVYKMKGGVF